MGRRVTATLCLLERGEVFDLLFFQISGINAGGLRFSSLSVPNVKQGWVSLPVKSGEGGV